MILTKCRNRKNRVDDIDESCPKMYYCDMEAERFLNYKEEFFMMLRFRKMMAVLLAAALTLTMLTACGGGGSSRASVDAKVKLTNDINDFLTGSGLKVEYDKKLDGEAETVQAHIKNANDKDKNNIENILRDSHRWMITVEIDEKISDEAKVVAGEVKKYMVLDSKDRDWSIGYYIDPKTDKDNKVIGKDIYVMLAWKEKTKK